MTTRQRVEKIAMVALWASGMLFLLGIVIFPFYYMFMASFKIALHLQADPADLSLTWEQVTDFSAYVDVWQKQGIGRYFFNSAYVSVLTTLLTIILATLGAYAVARLRFPGREVMAKSILLIYLFPAIVIVIPLYVIFSKVGLRNSLNGLVLVYLAQTLPVAIYMLDSYFRTLPKDLEEAGIIDGCTRFSVIWRITLPLSLPALTSVALYTFMIAWNEFLFALLFLDDPRIMTLPRGIQTIANSIDLSPQLLMAAAVITTLPVILLFLLFERFLVKGLTSGGVKG